MVTIRDARCGKGYILRGERLTVPPGYQRSASTRRKFGNPEMKCPASASSAAGPDTGMEVPVPQSNLAKAASTRRIRGRRRLSRLQELGYRDYAHYLRSRRWRTVKSRYRASDLPQVCMCGEVRVQLHHKTYERVGEEELTDLAPLCSACHHLVHVLEQRGEIGLDFKGIENDERAAAYAKVEETRKRLVEEDFRGLEKRRARSSMTLGQRLDAAMRSPRGNYRSSVRLIRMHVEKLEGLADEYRDQKAS